MQKRYNSSEIFNLAQERSVTIAIVYDKLFNTQEFGGPPPQRIRVGQWKIPENVSAGSDIVSFYAVVALGKDKLQQNLRQFAKELPITVEQF